MRPTRSTNAVKYLVSLQIVEINLMSERFHLERYTSRGGRKLHGDSNHDPEVAQKILEGVGLQHFGKEETPGRSSIADYR